MARLQAESKPKQSYLSPAVLTLAIKVGPAIGVAPATGIVTIAGVRRGRQK